MMYLCGGLDASIAAITYTSNKKGGIVCLYGLRVYVIDNISEELLGWRSWSDRCHVDEFG